MAEQDPGITVEQIVNSIEALTKELGGLKPEDRLGYLSGMIRCANASYPSSVAVFQLLHNPERVSMVEEEKLKELFSKFKDLCIERMIVNKDNRCSIIFQGAFHNNPGINVRAIDGANK